MLGGFGIFLTPVHPESVNIELEDMLVSKRVLFFPKGEYIYIYIFFYICIYIYILIQGHPSYKKWLVTPIYKPFRPFGRGPTTLPGLTNHRN